MKNFALVCLTTAIMMFYTMENGLHLRSSRPIYVPKIVQNLQEDLKNQFKQTEYANLVMALFTGKKLGIGQRTKKDLKKVNLIFLLSPSGFHLGVMLLFFRKFLSIICRKKIERFLLPLLLFIFYMQANFLGPGAFIRSLYLRFFARIKFKFKFKISIEGMIILIFIFSFFLGHYASSPLSFVMSFAFLGTFISLRDTGKIKLALGLFLIQLIINLFLAQKTSFISIVFGLFAVFIFKYLFLLILLYLISFYLYPSNWIEPLIKFYMLTIRLVAVELRGTFTSSSIFLILSLSILVFLRQSKFKNYLFASFFFLHTNTAKAPAIMFYL